MGRVPALFRRTAGSSSDARLQLEFLGGCVVTFASGHPCVLPTRKVKALLAYLAVPAGRFHAREKLTTLLWGDTPERQAKQSFRQALASLRRAVEQQAAPLLLTRGDTVALDARFVNVDVSDFEAALAGEDCESLASVARLYKGDFLADLGVNEPAFEEWRAAERERLQALALEALNRLLRRQLAADEMGPASQTAWRMLAIDPAQEPVHRTLMRLLLRQGRRAAALKQYQACVECLQRELGADPEEATRRLYREILRSAETNAVVQETYERLIPEPGAWGGGTPMVGREPELGRLRDALEAMLDGGGRITLVRGEAGIGKSRLLREFATGAIAAGVRVLLGRCHETEQILPLHAWIDALRGGRAALDQSIHDRLGTAANVQLARLFPELKQSPDESTGLADQHALLFDALVVLLSELAIGQPTVVILEDLHWVDGLSARFLAFLGRRVQRLPILVVGTMRPEELIDAPVLVQALRELRVEAPLDEVTLAALTAAESVALTRLLLPARGPEMHRDRVAGEISAASEGNPFVIVESVCALQDAGSGVGSPERRLARSVRDFVAGRLERLAELPRQIVSLAAAIGRGFSFELLVLAGRTSELRVAGAVEQLVRRHILVADGDRLDFSHEWIRRVGYEQLTTPERRLLHAAIGEALEALHRDDPEAIADQLGHHYSRAGDAWKAIAWLTRFADLAARRYALDDALGGLRQASALVDELPSAERPRQALDLALRQAFVLSILGRQREIWQIVQDQAANLDRVGDLRLSSEYHFRVGITCLYLGKHAECQRAAEQALAEGERAKDAECIGKALHVLSLSAYEAGRPREGIAYARRAAPLLDRSGTRHWLGLIYHDLALNCVVAGELGAAVKTAKREEALGAALGWARLQALAGQASAWALALQGEPERAIKAAQQSLAASRDAMASGLVKGCLGLAYLEQGDARAAADALAEAVSLLRKNPVRNAEARHLALLSEAQLLAGDVGEAQRTAIDALSLAEASGMGVSAGLAQRALGRVALASNKLDDARMRLTQAFETFERSEMAFEAARTRLDLARLCARLGERNATRDHLAAALTAFHAAKAPKRAEAAYKLARALGVTPIVASAAEVVASPVPVRGEP